MIEDFDMELIIEILTGKRKGQNIVLQESLDIEDEPSMSYLLEMDAVSLHLKLKEPCTEVTLLMGDTHYPFFYDGMRNNLFHYTLMPRKRSYNSYDAVFYNYFGVARLEIKVVFNKESPIIRFQPIEILARKLGAEQAAYMADYILKESEGDLNSCFNLNSKSHEGGEQPKRVIDKLIKAIQTLEEIIPHIANKPLTRVSSETRMQNGYQTTEIDEQGLAWLNENLSVLEETDDVERAHVHYDGTYYLAREIQAPIIVEHTDIYENRVIYSFLLKLKRFSIELERHLSQLDRKTTHQYEVGYCSFFSVMDNWISKANGIEINNLRNYKVRITRLIHVFDKKIPVTIADNGLPILTQKVKSNRFYASVFRIMVEWYRFNKIDWRSQEKLLAIKSIPKLFEYYTVLRVRAELKKLCQSHTTIQLNNQAIFNATYQNCQLALYYEPEYWMVGHKRVNESGYLNTEIRADAFYRTEAGRGFNSSNHEYSKRVPDIVIEIKNNAEEPVLLVLDAKYSSMETAFRDYLRDCGMKYIHGIHGKDGSSPVQAMILICPTQEKITLADMHAPPYGLFDNKPVFPVLGVQGVGLMAKSEEQSQATIGETIKHLLDLILKSKPK